MHKYKRHTKMHDSITNIQECCSVYVHLHMHTVLDVYLVYLQQAPKPSKCMGRLSLSLLSLSLALLPQAMSATNAASMWNNLSTCIHAPLM